MIKPIQAQAILTKPDKRSQSASQGFADAFQKAFDDVNHKQLDANDKIAELAAGRSKDIHGTMIAVEKADISQRLLLAVRNKLVNAYEEIMRMQV